MSCFLSIAGILLKEFKEWSMELTDRIRRAGAELAGQRQRPVKLTHVEGRCLHQYFYLQHPVFGFMQIRLQTWAPFMVHVNINGREWLAGQLRQAGIAFEKRDNCFVDVPQK